MHEHELELGLRLVTTTATKGRYGGVAVLRLDGSTCCFQSLSGPLVQDGIHFRSSGVRWVGLLGRGLREYKPTRP